MSFSDWIMGTTHQLLNEKNQAILRGDAEAVARLKKADKQIGRLMQPFNGVARVPENVADKIESLLKENEAALARVLAVRSRARGRAEIIGDFIRNESAVTEEPLRWLEYQNVYRSPSGNRIEQRVAQVRVGP